MMNLNLLFQFYPNPKNAVLLEPLGIAFNVVVYAVKVAALLVIVLMIARFFVDALDANPFSRFPLFVRRWSDRFVAPLRLSLIRLGAPPNAAPFIIMLFAILLGWFGISLVASVFNALVGILSAVREGSIFAALGYALFGALAVYMTLLFIRIVFSWTNMGAQNKVVRWLNRVTDPLLVPLRKIIPPLGVFDISPIIAFLIIMLFQNAIAQTLLRGWQVFFFN